MRGGIIVSGLQECTRSFHFEGNGLSLLSNQYQYRQLKKENKFRKEHFYSRHTNKQINKRWKIGQMSAKNYYLLNENTGKREPIRYQQKCHSIEMKWNKHVSHTKEFRFFTSYLFGLYFFASKMRKLVWI